MSELSRAHTRDVCSGWWDTEPELGRMRFAVGQIVVFTTDAGSSDDADDDDTVPESFIAWHLHRLASRRFSLPTPAHLAFWLWFKWHTLAASERSGYPIGRVVRERQVGAKYSLFVKR